MSEDECQYWLYEHGYRAKNASLAEFSKLCDIADRSELINTIDCQYWLFERGHLAAKEWLMNASEIEQLEAAQFANHSQKFAQLNSY